MSAPKILILTPGLGSGGAQKVFKDQILFYSDHFSTTGCVFNWDGALEEEKDFAVLSLEVPAGKHWISKFYFFCQRVIKVRAIKRKFKFDVSISHLEGADYVNILSRQGEKVICYIHGTKFHDGAIRGALGWVRKKILMPWLYRKADVIIPVSTGIKAEFLTVLGISNEKINIITNGFDVKKIEQQALEAIPSHHHALLKNHKTVTLCSRLAPQKNQEAFLFIFVQLLKITKCKLIILGDGELRNDLISKSIELGLRVYHVWSNNLFTENFDIYFLGNQLNPFPYLSKTSIFALPSSWEGFPLALCEAMACRVPVVASDCPTGPEEILFDTENDSDFGFLLPIPVKHDDEILRTWVKILTALLTETLLATEYAGKAKQRVKKFGKENMEVAWLELVKF